LSQQRTYLSSGLLPRSPLDTHTTDCPDGVLAGPGGTAAETPVVGCVGTCSGANLRPISSSSPPASPRLGNTRPTKRWLRATPRSWGLPWTP